MPTMDLTGPNVLTVEMVSGFLIGVGCSGARLVCSCVERFSLDGFDFDVWIAFRLLDRYE